MEPQHSDRYLWRNHNPKGLIKPLEEHMAHTIKRVKQRFDLDMSEEEYHKIVANLYHQKKGKFLYKISSDNVLYEYTFKGKTIWLMYGKPSKDKTVPRIKTALKPIDIYHSEASTDGLIVPTILSGIYDHKSFCEKFKSILNIVHIAAHELDLNDKKTFFTSTKYSMSIKSAALILKSNNSRNIIGCIVNGIIQEHFQDYEIED